MSRISYQAILDAPAGSGGPFAALSESDVGTRRKQATKSLRVRISPGQRAWLTEVTGVSGGAVDDGAVVRALLDVGVSLDVDWPMVTGAGALRRAVRDSVRVRRANASAEGA